jgi:hypothetical protein
MKNKYYHNYIEYFLRKLDKKYNRNIILFFEPDCKRTNVVYHKEKNQHVLTYGTELIETAKKLGRKWRYHIRYCLSHELGHIIHCTPYETFKQKVEAEYQAERFMLNYLKENYYANYLYCCKEGYAMVHDKKWATCKSEKHYRLAFTKIKEYAE